VPFDWAFIQCGPEQLSEAEYRSLLASAIFDGPQPFFEAKVALDVIGHRLSSQQAHSSMGSGVLLLIADIMQAGRSAFHLDNFVGLKEHLFGMPQINALLTSSTISSEMIEQGIEPKVPRCDTSSLLNCRDTPNSRCGRGPNQHRRS